MPKLESVRVGQALTSSSPVMFRSKDTREQRGDHCGNHCLHPRGGCAGVCHLLPAQERQDPMWPRWETGHVSTAACHPGEPLGPEILCHRSCFPSHCISCSLPKAEGGNSAALGGTTLGSQQRFQLPTAWGLHCSPSPRREVMRRTAE